MGYPATKIDGKDVTLLRFLVVVVSLAAARAQEQIRVCDEANPCTGRGSSTPSRAETNSRFIGFGIVTAIAILVAANILICIIRCIFRRRAAPQERPTPRVRIWSSHSLPVVSRARSVKQVYVLNPAGSLKIGKKDSKKVLNLSGALGREHTASAAGDRPIPFVSASSWVAQGEAGQPADRRIVTVDASAGEGRIAAEDLAERGLAQGERDANRGSGTPNQQEQVLREQV